MAQWHRNIQDIITIIDACIRAQQDEALTLRALAQKLGYSEYYTSRKFRELSGMTLRDYLRLRRLAFALRDVRDTDAGILDIAVKYGFSSNEAFTHAFKKAYGVSPSAYRTAPGPVVLQTILRPFDCYLTEGAGSPSETQNEGAVKTYFVHIPPHKFLHIRNYESIGYQDFWQRQSAIPGQDCETICGLARQHPRQARRCGRKKQRCGQRAAHGLDQRADGAHLQLGHPAGGGLRACACRRTTPARPRRRCSSWTCPPGSTSCSSTGRSISRRKAPPWKRRSSRPCAASTMPPAATGSTCRRAECFIFTTTARGFSNTCARCAGTKHHKKQDAPSGASLFFVSGVYAFQVFVCSRSQLAHGSMPSPLSAEIGNT